MAAFDECKASVSIAALPAHSDLTVPLAVVTDALITAKGAVHQQ